MSKSVAIVTGASQGIGRSTALRLARDFGAIVLVARHREKLEATAESVRQAGAEALVIDTDLGEPTSAKVVVEKALAAFGRMPLSPPSMPPSSRSPRRSRTVASPMAYR